MPKELTQSQRALLETWERIRPTLRPSLFRIMLALAQEEDTDIPENILAELTAGAPRRRGHRGAPN